MILQLIVHREKWWRTTKVKGRNKGGNGQGVRERETCRLRGCVVRVRLWFKPWESGRGESGRCRGRARQRIPAAFKWSSHWEVLRFKMVSCDVDCVFDLSFEGFVLFSGGENLARSHFRTTNSQQKVGKPKQGDCKDRFFFPSSYEPHFFCFYFFRHVFLLSLLQDLACILMDCS